MQSTIQINMQMSICLGSVFIDRIAIICIDKSFAIKWAFVGFFGLIDQVNLDAIYITKCHFPPKVSLDLEFDLWIKFCPWLFIH